MSAFDNEKQVILRPVVSDNAKAPTFHADIVIDGEQYRAALWPWTKKDGTPILDKKGNQLFRGVAKENAQDSRVKELENRLAAMEELLAVYQEYE